MGVTHNQLQRAARHHLLLHFSKQGIGNLLVIERGDGCYVVAA